MAPARFDSGSSHRIDNGGVMNFCGASDGRFGDAIAAADDAIAVVAMACRYPGGCDDPDALWRMIVARETALRPVPAGRWPSGDAISRKGDRRAGGFLDAPFPESFDAAFFDISPAEAVALDPQQRLLLEVGWRAIEQAGIAVDAEAGREIGVFVGISTGDHQHATLWRPGAAGAEPFTATGASFAAAAGRLSYSFGFTGPSMAVDTACSSSLVAIHLAGQAIRNGDCDGALVLGVNALLRPNLFDCLETMNLLSPDGVCRAFDAAANGYVRAEGCGALVLKPLGAARRDGNRVLATIRGSAVNQDGRTAGLTAPSGAAQRRVIARALAVAGLEAGDVDYVEAHGTGTPLGDAIELAALADYYASGRDAARPLLIGSVKTNIGHLEAGAGMAGVIKKILALEHGFIPGHPRLDRPTPHIDWDTLAMRAPTAATPWPETDAPRRAGVSSYGFSGTNAHVIVEQAPSLPQRMPAEDGAVVLALSARTPAALDEFTAAVADWLEANPGNMRHVAFTLGVGRTVFACRRAVVGDDVAAMVRALRGQVGAPFADPKLNALARSWEGGEHVDWGRLYPGAQLLRLPGHPLYPQRYWIDEPEAARAIPLATPSITLPERREDWRALVQCYARAVLGDGPPLDADMPLTDQGFTSLLGLELRRALEAALDRSLPAGLLYDYPTLDRIAAMLSGDVASIAPSEAPSDSGDFAFLDALSDAELADLIDREVDRL